MYNLISYTLENPEKILISFRQFLTTQKTKSLRIHNQSPRKVFRHGARLRKLSSASHRTTSPPSRSSPSTSPDGSARVQSTSSRPARTSIPLVPIVSRSVSFIFARSARLYIGYSPLQAREVSSRSIGNLGFCKMFSRDPRVNGTFTLSTRIEISSKFSKQHNVVMH